MTRQRWKEKAPHRGAACEGGLQNAASISGLLLTTECLITELPEEKKAGGNEHSHDHGGMM